jgi:hypothetical protein
LQPFLVDPFFDQASNKGFALLVAGQFEIRLQEFGLWTSPTKWQLQATPSITTFLTHPYVLVCLFVTEATQFCVHGGLQQIKGSLANPL